MYQMLSLILTELPLHVALFACGAIGWAVTRWANRRYCNPRLQVRARKLAEAPPKELEEEPAAAETASPTGATPPPSPVQQGGKARRRARPLSKAEGGAPAEAEAESTPPALSPSAPLAEDDAARPADAALHVQEAVAVCAPPATMEDEEALLACSAPAGVSERVTRLMAKKAERKARKAHEREQLDEQLAAPEAAAAAATSGRQQGGPGQDASPQDTGAPGDVPAQVVLPAGADVEAPVGPPSAQVSPRKPPRQESERKPPRQESERVAWSQLSEGEPSELLKKLPKHLRLLSLESDVDTAELSTADEGTRSAWEGTWDKADDSFEEEDDEEAPEAEAECRFAQQDAHEHCHGYQEEPQAEVHAGWPHDVHQRCHAKPPHHQWAPAPPQGEDGWMLPFDEMVRQPPHREGPFVQHLDPSVQLYQPVLSPDGQQRLYTDGEQVYMMACIEVEDNPSMTQMQVIHPVTHPCDPLHEVVMGSHPPSCQGFWPASASYDCYMPGGFETPLRPPACPARDEEDEFWDVCWDFLP